MKNHVVQRVFNSSFTADCEDVAFFKICGCLKNVFVQNFLGKNVFQVVGKAFAGELQIGFFFCPEFCKRGARIFRFIHGFVFFLAQSEAEKLVVRFSWDFFNICADRIFVNSADAGFPAVAQAEADFRIIFQERLSVFRKRKIRRAADSVIFFKEFFQKKPALNALDFIRKKFVFFRINFPLLRNQIQPGNVKFFRIIINFFF